MAPLLLLPALLLGPAAAELLTLLPDRDTSAIPACQDDTVLSCILVTVDYAALEGEQLILPGGVMVSLEDRPLTDAVTFANSDGVEATFSLGHSGAEIEVYGEVEVENGTIFTLEPCSSSFPGCHVLKQEDMEMMSQLEAAEESAWSLVEGEGRRALTVVESRALSALEQQGIDDPTTVVTYSLKVYYTPQFAAKTTDIPLFVDQMIAETNQGYINSKIPLRIALACIEAATLNDEDDSSKMLKSFRTYKSSEAELRQSADAAMLLVDKFDTCGIGYLRPWVWNDISASVVARGCALGYFTPIHELGHNLGAMHDRINGANSAYPYGLGKHMGFIGSRGYRTVMAYYTGPDGKKYYSKANYLSNPNIEYQGMKTGTAEEDNARLLTQNRFIFAAQGDESDQACTPAASTTAAPTTPAPTTHAPTTTNSGSGSGSGCGNGCWCSPLFLIENRKSNLGNRERKDIRYITLQDGGKVDLEAKTMAENQQWRWVHCKEQDNYLQLPYWNNFLQSATKLGYLSFNGKNVLLGDNTNSSPWEHFATTGLLQDTTTKKVAFMKKKNRPTYLHMTSRVRYFKGTKTPWKTYQWDLVPLS